jgi:hypothetical protein
MQERPDERIAGGGAEGAVSEVEGAPALAEDEIRTERAHDDGEDRLTAPGMTEPSGPLPDEPASDGP